MRYLVLAVDYDGTLATDGEVQAQTLEALRKFAASGRKLVLVTGRELDELLGVFPDIGLFHLVVAENGALLYRPQTREHKLLGTPPSEAFVQMLRQRKIEPLAVGRSIVATLRPNETAVLEVIRDLGLELQVIFNKSAVMILQAGVNKASGLNAALTEMGMSPHNVVGVGDGENDHALLNLCEYSAAVANAVPMLKAEADLELKGARGAGVVELIEAILRDDLPEAPIADARRKLLMGSTEDGEEVFMPAACANLLIAGTSGSGKSTLATGLLERLAAQGYQFCIIDPEGDYEEFAAGIVFGNNERAPSAEEIMTALDKPDANVIVNLIGLPLQDRPAFFLQLLPQLQQLRARTGRPHWLLVDETHHLLPTDWAHAEELPNALTSMIYITVHPDWIAPDILKGVDMVAALGEQPVDTLADFGRVVGAEPQSGPLLLEAGEALLWLKTEERAPFKLRIEKSSSDRRRHRRKYAQGELPPERSFYFRGPKDALNLRAQNLILFIQMAEGVDDETWLFHLAQHDYSSWMRQSVKDDTLADQVEQIETQSALSAEQSRAQIKAAVEEHYTLPASKGETGSSSTIQMS